MTQRYLCGGCQNHIVEQAERTNLARRAATVSLASTVVVVAAKLVAAAFSSSISVLAEGLQSLLDVFMAILVVWTVKIAAEPPDKDHPYGHGKAELLTSAFQMVLVLLTAGVIAWQATIRLLEPREIVAEFGLYAMGYSFVANVCVIVYIRRVIRKINSPVLEGEVEHLRADALASAGVFVGLVVYAVSGWEPLDPLIAIGFTAIGAIFAIRQLRKVIHPLMDGSLPPDDIAKLEAVLDDHKDVKGYHNVHTREAGSMRFVDIHVLLDDHLTFVQAHDLAEHIEDHLSQALGGAKVTIHYEPFEAELEHRRLEHDEPRPK